MSNLFDVIRNLSAGEFSTEAEARLASLVTAIDERGGSGTLTLTLKIKKTTRSGAMTITGESVSKPPKMPPHEALMFPTPQGRLTKNHPGQGDLPLQAVPISVAQQGE